MVYKFRGNRCRGRYIQRHSNTCWWHSRRFTQCDLQFLWFWWYGSGSFYTCDETWNQEDEISLFDTGDVLGEQKNNEWLQTLRSFRWEEHKIIYVYDFINMWTFLVELAVEEQVAGISIPKLYSRMEKCRMSLRKKLWSWKREWFC
jgi:hypothetical protein